MPPGRRVRRRSGPPPRCRPGTPSTRSAPTRPTRPCLGVAPGTPLLRARRHTSSAAGVPLEYGEDRYRPDRVTFTIDNARPAAAGAGQDLRVRKHVEE
ncbi:UTRA domain-containing protein [Nocardia grenadensis]|uniref:UTRA domain-containing protein n=1 Tax=Nocardia grenadensis TaxID=931537 RepID=UPI0024815E5A|nr:UTRA domain-containing protein [Nocardia grenadensis]